MGGNFKFSAQDSDLEYFFEPSQVFDKKLPLTHGGQNTSNTKRPYGYSDFPTVLISLKMCVITLKSCIEHELYKVFERFLKTWSCF